MSNLESIISSFHIQGVLNPKIWSLPDEKFMGDPEGQHYKMRPKIRERLLDIAYEFIEFIKIDFVISDVVMTGSLANYNWSKYSDIDLHIIADFSQFDKAELDLYQELFTLKKTLFNDKHDITIFGYDTELYIQDEKEVHTSTGVYSVLYDEWIDEPKPIDVKIDRNLVKSKAEKWMKEIDTILENIQDESVENAKKILKKIKDKIKKYRKSGLEEKGEFSIENLVFKVLRRNNYIQKIFDFENKFVDKKLSLKESSLSSPLNNLYVTSKFDEKRSYENHPGVDLRASSGTEIKSPADGEVIESEIKNDACGGTIYIKHPNGFKSRYCHVKELKVKQGDNVKQGQTIGISGGNASDTGAGNSKNAHLHFEIYKDGKLVDPMQYIDSSGAITTPVNTQQSESDKIIEKLIELGEKSTFLFNLFKIAISNKTFKNLSTSKGIPYDEDVEYLQTALQLTGNLLPKYGVDGLFGPETENAVKQFQKSVDLPETGVVETKDLQYLYAKLLKAGFTDSDLSKVQKSSEVQKFIIEKDEDFYNSILTLLEAPLSNENLKFLKAWRQAEGGNALNNPFNTTLNLPKDEKINNYNSIGVKNYSTPNYGIEATVRTIMLPGYKCILEGLKNNIGADKISECPALMLWSKGIAGNAKGEYVNKVLRGNIDPTPIKIKELV